MASGFGTLLLKCRPCSLKRSLRTTLAQPILLGYCLKVEGLGYMLALYRDSENKMETTITGVIFASVTGAQADRPCKNAASCQRSVAAAQKHRATSLLCTTGGTNGDAAQFEIHTVSYCTRHRVNMKS